MTKATSAVLLFMLMGFGFWITIASWFIYDNINKLNTCRPELKKCNQGVFMIGLILIIAPMVMMYCGCLADDDDINTSIIIFMFGILGLVLLILGSIIAKNKDGCGKVSSSASMIWGLGLGVFIISMVILIANNFDKIKGKLRQPELTEAERKRKESLNLLKQQTKALEESAKKAAAEKKEIDKKTREMNETTELSRKAKELSDKANIALGDSVINETGAEIKKQQAVSQLTRAQQMSAASEAQVEQQKNKGPSVKDRASALEGRFPAFSGPLKPFPNRL